MTYFLSALLGAFIIVGLPVLLTLALCRAAAMPAPRPRPHLTAVDGSCNVRRREQVGEAAPGAGTKDIR